MKVLEEVVWFKYARLVAQLSKGLRGVQGPEVGNVKIPSFVWLPLNSGVLALSNSYRKSYVSIPGFSLLPAELVGIS